MEDYSREDVYNPGYEESSNDSYEEEYDEYDESYSDGYNDGYNKGYDEGWEDGYYAEDPFRCTISRLMYDHEYDIVRSLLEYDQEEVEEALEYAFGTSDIDSVIAHLYEKSITVVGTCNICGNSIYADDEVAFNLKEKTYLHKICVTDGENDN